MEIKFCKDCRHFVPRVREVYVPAKGVFSVGRYEKRADDGGEFAKCARTDLVGAGGREGRYCSSEREEWHGSRLAGRPLDSLSRSANRAASASANDPRFRTLPSISRSPEQGVSRHAKAQEVPVRREGLHPDWNQTFTHRHPGIQGTQTAEEMK